jgi:hypothetical protein
MEPTPLLIDFAGINRAGLVLDVGLRHWKFEHLSCP